MFESRGKLRGRVKLAHLEILQSCGVQGPHIYENKLHARLKFQNEFCGLSWLYCIHSKRLGAWFRFIKLQSARPISSRNQQIASIRAEVIKPVLNTGVKQIKTSAITKNGESLEMSFQ